MTPGRRSTVGPRTARVAGLAVAAGLLVTFALPAGPAAAQPNLKELRQQAKQLQRQLDRLAVEQGLAVERYDAAQDALMQATNGEVNASIGVSDSQRAAQASADEAARRVRAIYLSGGPLALTASMLGSSSIGDAMVRWHAIEGIVATDADRVDTQQAAVARQRTVEAAASLTRAQVMARQSAADQAAAVVSRTIAMQRAMLAHTDSQVVALAEQERAQAEAAALARAAQSARAAGIGGISDAAGHGLEGGTADSQTLPDVPAPNATAAAAIAAAATRLGMPYVWGATGPTTFDCSGLMQWAYAQAGVLLPRTSRAQYAALPHVALSELAPGDLVFYAIDVNQPSTIHHVGMYVGNGLSLYAPQTGSVVKIGPVGYGLIIGAARPTAGS
ncbi:NlpC/P60 family protein [Angustibacter sp. McL0619]|uniref:C40 family peptidase n=1 Tax=Angustibacter sp. McL0619 TaxID=3415676 RepID=UPI003CF22FCD